MFEQVIHGFFFGIGFFSAFIFCFFIFISLLSKLLKSRKNKKEKEKYKDKLTEKVMGRYSEYLEENEKFEDLRKFTDIKDHILEKGEIPDFFFEWYKIERKTIPNLQEYFDDEDYDEEALGGLFLRKYIIHQK